MEIKILGTGCPKCQRLEQLAREVAAELGLAPRFEHVRDMAAIVQYPILSTPALVVDGDVRVSGRLPSKAELAAWLQGRQPPGA
jgi:small redox-active disulfide protein 2